ncbi:MAG TPA: DNA-binding protein [Candidatus Omnitrophica bacterium]|nr:DNA-binding protein [Candidatus Omnitrophota bacterium]
MGIKCQVSGIRLKTFRPFKLFLFCCLLATCNLQLATVFAQPVQSNDLIANAKSYDGKTVEYEGELVGDILRRKDFAWLNVYDGQNAIGVWSSNALLAPVKWAGGYEKKGDMLGINGIFHRACPEHGGGLDIHAQSIVLLKEGSRVLRPIERKRVLWLGLLLGVLACLLIIHILQQRQRAR